MQPQLSISEINEYLDEVFPQMQGRFHVDALSSMQATVRMLAREEDLRPGNTVSGPAIFTLADCAFYIAALAMVGRKALTVTTSCHIDFMRKAPAGELIGEAKVHKLGRALIVGDVLIHTGDEEKPIARASLTYSIPPQ